jgi:hypothetical protein
VRATDNRPASVARTAEATVVITIIRDSGPPQFISTPYITSVAINQAVNTSFFNVQAIDNDLRVSSFFLSDTWKKVTHFIYMGDG